MSNEGVRKKDLERRTISKDEKKGHGYYFFFFLVTPSCGKKVN